MYGIQSFNFPYGNACSEIFLIYRSIKHNPAVDDFRVIIWECLVVINCKRIIPCLILSPIMRLMLAQSQEIWTQTPAKVIFALCCWARQLTLPSV